MKKCLLGSLAISCALLLFARPGFASVNACEMMMVLPNCGGPFPYQPYAPDSQPTIALGCSRYPPPVDGGYGLPMLSYYMPTLADARFVIEAGGETLTGGTFSDAEITCNSPCLLDGGFINNCPIWGVVRYSGPLIPGKEHKITWTNSGNSVYDVPFVVFTVAAATLVDAGLDTASGTGTTTGTAVTSVVTGTGTATATTGASTSVPIATDTGTATATTGASTAVPIATDTGTATATTGASTSAAIATDVSRDAGTGTAKCSSSCSCSLDARKHASLVSLLVLTFLWFARTGLRARTRPRTPPR